MHCASVMTGELTRPVVMNFGGRSDIYAQNAYRLDTDRGPVAIAHMPSGQSAVQFSTQTISLSLMAFGWSDTDLVRLVESIRSGRSRWTASHGADGSRTSAFSERDSMKHPMTRGRPSILRRPLRVSNAMRRP